MKFEEWKKIAKSQGFIITFGMMSDLFLRGKFTKDQTKLWYKKHEIADDVTPQLIMQIRSEVEKDREVAAKYRAEVLSYRR